MLKVKRPPLSPVLQKRLSKYQRQIDVEGKKVAIIWKNFRDADGKQDQKQQPSVVTVLRDEMFHGKCAYCEKIEAKEIEHYISKSFNTTQTFQWDNLLWSCDTCNKKKPDVPFIIEGQTQLLNPYLDDPICYFATNLKTGWLDVKAGLSPANAHRASYTIELLNLNLRDALLNERAKNISQFFHLLAELFETNADHQNSLGYTVSERFIKLLNAKTPFLGPIRQILYSKPEIHHELLLAIPELEPILATWALPPDDCSKLEESHV